MASPRSRAAALLAFALLLSLGFHTGLAAATPLPDTATGEDSDALFLRARTLAKEGRREEARACCRRALERSPEYHDVRVYLGRLHAWDGQYDAGRTAFRAVLENRPEHLDAREAWIDLETWADRPAEALRLCEEGLRLQPGAAVLHYRKAKLLKGRGDHQAALASVRTALQLDPKLPAARSLRDDLRELTQRSKVALEGTYETFSRSFEPWRTLSPSLAHRFDFGTVIARVNRANRFGEPGTQVELDAYPRFREGLYAYLNAGYSRDTIFPVRRGGAEIYTSLPAAMEASVGFRYLDFRDTSVTIYTGSLTKYLGNALGILRLNLTPSAVGSSLSGTLSGRWYLADADSYFSASLGYGISPEQSLATLDLTRLRSRKAGLGAQKRLGPSLVLSCSASLERQEFLPGEYRDHRTFTSGVEWRF